jgi:tripartite-type tricarboxylate transporter receptor subunit TctC
MDRKGFPCLATAIAAAALALATPGASAQGVESFYKGANVTIIVGSGAGGGYDVYTRVLARSYGKHLPGQPHIIVQNMPGAAGIKALNHLYSIAPKDGSVFESTYNTLPLDPLFGGQGEKYDPRKLAWVGSIDKQVNVCLAWGKSSFKTFDDVYERQMTLASSGAAGWRSILPRMMNNLTGSKFKVIDGYETSGMIPAVEKGEVDGMCTTYETMQATAADWINNKRVTFLAQFGEKPIPDLAGVTMGLERIKNPDDLKAVRLVLLQQEYGRPYVAPPDLPPARLKALQTAFDETMTDPTFVADAKKTGMGIDLLTGQRMADIIAGAYEAPKETIARANEILARASR